MARDIQERENLLQDATALVSRIELKFVPDSLQRFTIPDRLFSGFRQSGELSLYFDDDPVFQFGQSGRLRRAFDQGLIIKADRGQLISWQRKRANHQVIMQSHRFEASQQAQWMGALSQRFESLRQVLQLGDYEIVGQFPANEDLVSRLLSWLNHHQNIQIAQSPGVQRGRNDTNLEERQTR